MVGAPGSWLMLFLEGGHVASLLLSGRLGATTATDASKKLMNKSLTVLDVNKIIEQLVIFEISIMVIH